MYDQRAWADSVARRRELAQRSLCAPGAALRSLPRHRPLRRSISTAAARPGPRRQCLASFVCAAVLLIRWAVRESQADGLGDARESSTPPDFDQGCVGSAPYAPATARRRGTVLTPSPQPFLPVEEEVVLAAWLEW
ncbi:unnamed protein product [Amoebophrya sp. A120]|nr:unnamed protein product [Amoebophrya sp. A120]|eukprot:GSA120T00023146001.1